MAMRTRVSVISNRLQAVGYGRLASFPAALGALARASGVDAKDQVVRNSLARRGYEREVTPADCAKSSRLLSVSLLRALARQLGTCY